jgi:cytochrome c peroxidase
VSPPVRREHLGLLLALLVGTAGCSPAVGAPSSEAEASTVALGRFLFYERRLSLGEDRSCGICHEPALGFTDGFVRAVGTTHELHPRNTLTLTNVGTREELTWLESAPDVLEEQLLVPLLGEHPPELGMGDTIDQMIESFREDVVYAELFPAAFPGDVDPFTLDRLAEAIAAFERTLVSATSPYDRYLDGDEGALDAQQTRGMVLFRSDRLRCARCHSGPDLDQPASETGVTTDRHGYFQTGLYDLDGDGAYPADGRGRFEATGDAEDMGQFRTPTLRNVELTGPYYHDGTGANLADVIANYAAGGRVLHAGPSPGDGRANPYKSDLVAGFDLSADEAADLEAFLRALTDWDFIEDPAFADPWPRD